MAVEGSAGPTVSCSLEHIIDIVDDDQKGSRD
jgi:hypothetical protein